MITNSVLGFKRGLHAQTLASRLPGGSWYLVTTNNRAYEPFTGHTHIYIYIHTCMHIYICIHIHIYTHVYIHTYIYIRIHI